MGKPDVHVRAPGWCFAGQRVAFAIDVVADTETKIDWIEARLVGTQGWRVGSGQSRIEARATYPELADQLMAAGVLPAGARIDHASLALDLVVVASSSLRHVFFADVEVSIAAWDRAHHVTARSADQTIPFLAAVVPTLMRCELVGTLVRWDDDALVFERPMSVIDERDLAAIARALAEIAEAIRAARVHIGPPPGLAIELDAWQDVARWLGAPLCVGDLSIDGALAGVPVSITPRWTGATWDRVIVTMGDPETASAAVRAITLALPEPARDARAVTDDAVAARLVEWPADFVDLNLSDGVASAACVLRPAGDDGPPVADPGRVQRLVEELRTVRAMLDPSSGPYR